MLGSMAGAKKVRAAEWAKRVERWQRSGLSAAKFGVREGIAGAQLSWWKWLAHCSSPRVTIPLVSPTRRRSPHCAAFRQSTPPQAVSSGIGSIEAATAMPTGLSGLLRWCAFEVSPEHARTLNGERARAYRSPRFCGVSSATSPAKSSDIFAA